MVEHDLREVKSAVDSLTAQREREHTENRQVLARIEDQGKLTGAAVSRIEGTVDGHEVRINSLETTRDQLNGVLRAILLAATIVPFIAWAVALVVKQAWGIP